MHQRICKSCNTEPLWQYSGTKLLLLLRIIKTKVDELVSILYMAVENCGLLQMKMLVKI